MTIHPLALSLRVIHWWTVSWSLHSAVLLCPTNIWHKSIGQYLSWARFSQMATTHLQVKRRMKIQNKHMDNSKSRSKSVNSIVDNLYLGERLLQFCYWPFEGNPPANGGFPSKRPVMQSFFPFSDVSLIKLLNKQARGKWMTMSRCSFVVTSMSLQW